MILGGPSRLVRHAVFVFAIAEISGTLAVRRTDRLAGRIGECSMDQEMGVGGD
jgi:hypothetical protein